MKFAHKAAVLVIAIAAPISAFAGNNGPISRAQVRAELLQLEQAGYQPASDSVNYPSGIQSAERRLQHKASFDSSGGVAAGSSASGKAGPSAGDLFSMYGRH